MDCCSSKNGDGTLLCSEARLDAGITPLSNSPNKVKICNAYYVENGETTDVNLFNGLKDYFYPELLCQGNNPSVSCTSYGRYTYPGFTGITCKGKVSQYPIGWKNDTDKSEDSCVMSDLPAHVDLDIVKTGTCVDYSVVLTTLLRMLGYKSDEVYTAVGFYGTDGHAYNLVKLPGDTKFSIFETVGNYQKVVDKIAAHNYVDFSPYHFPYCAGMRNSAQIYNYLNYPGGNCMNDEYAGPCPNLDDIYGCSK